MMLEKPSKHIVGLKNFGSLPVRSHSVELKLLKRSFYFMTIFTSRSSVLLCSCPICYWLQIIKSLITGKETDSYIFSTEGVYQ